MLLKILLIVGVIAAVYFIFFKKGAPSVAAKRDGATQPDDDTMVPCETCGVFVSVKDAYLRDGKYYCSQSCMEQA